MQQMKRQLNRERQQDANRMLWVDVSLTAEWFRWPTTERWDKEQYTEDTCCAGALRTKQHCYEPIWWVEATNKHDPLSSLEENRGRYEKARERRTKNKEQRTKGGVRENEVRMWLLSRRKESWKRNWQRGNTNATREKEYCRAWKEVYQELVGWRWENTMKKAIDENKMTWERAAVPHWFRTERRRRKERSGRHVRKMKWWGLWKPSSLMQSLDSCCPFPKHTL